MPWTTFNGVRSMPILPFCSVTIGQSFSCLSGRSAWSGRTACGDNIPPFPFRQEQQHLIISRHLRRLNRVRLTAKADICGHKLMSALGHKRTINCKAGVFGLTAEAVCEAKHSTWLFLYEAVSCRTNRGR